MKGKPWLLLSCFALALVASPYLACSNQAESDFTYSEADMTSALLGTWQGTASIDGEAVPFSLTLEQARSSAPRTEPPCASRSFVKPAAACIAQTRMPVLGTLTSENPAFNGALDGAFIAYRTLEEAELSLHVESGAVLSGKVDDDAVTDGLLGGPLRGAFSLQRP